MTAQADPRELPIRVPIISGESLHSWIEALAARYRMAVRELLPALGITAPCTPYGLILDVDSQALRSLERQAAFPPADWTTRCSSAFRRWTWPELPDGPRIGAGKPFGRSRLDRGSARAAWRRTEVAGRWPGT
jgi:hypothetical protein